MAHHKAFLGFVTMGLLTRRRYHADDVYHCITTAATQRSLADL